MAVIEDVKDTFSRQQLGDSVSFTKVQQTTNLVNLFKDVFQLLLGRSETHRAKNVVLEILMRKSVIQFFCISCSTLVVDPYLQIFL